MLIAPHEFKEVQTLVRSLCGLVLTDDKTYLLRARLEAVVKAHGCAHFAEYLDRLRLRSEGLMRDELVEALTTGETSFNRDTHPFEEFRRQILPALAETVRRRREERYPVPLARIWSAGCSTGQEPYSLAMAIHEFVAANPAFDLPSRFWLRMCPRNHSAWRRLAAIRIVMWIADSPRNRGTVTFAHTGSSGPPATICVGGLSSVD